jgi:hypothetical protein
MQRITRYANTVAVLTVIALRTTRIAVAGRLRQLDNDRGDVPGWAIASGAACVLAALVYAAYNAVISKWIAKIK